MLPSPLRVLHPRQNRAEPLRRKEGVKFRLVIDTGMERIKRLWQWRLVIQSHESFRNARLFGMGRQQFAPLRLFDLACPHQQCFQIAIFKNKLRGGLDADARDARDVVGAVARQGLHINHLVRRHAEFCFDFGGADGDGLHRIVKLNARPH